MKPSEQSPSTALTHRHSVRGLHEGQTVLVNGSVDVSRYEIAAIKPVVDLAS